MQIFKSLILPMQGKNKGNLRGLCSSEKEDRVFYYKTLEFYFADTSYRNPEKLLLYLRIPSPFIIGNTDAAVVYEDYLLRTFSSTINTLSLEYVNENKNVREKAQFGAQLPDNRILRRNGIFYDESKQCFTLRINFNVPLVNAISINAKAAVRAVHDILLHIDEALAKIDTKNFDDYLITFRHQNEIRAYIRQNDICVFVANGSILPRENGADKPMKEAIPFVSPPDMSVTIPLSDGGKISGMAIPRGVTVITGGGYSGKSTLLDAIENGIYNHIPGDGREYVISDESALKICAEYGRPVSNLDISPFFRFLPGSTSPDNFSTPHASGSVSQAANIVEGVCGGCKLILIDEDRSATNFMIRDKNMRRIIQHDPIIPFTDRIRELSSEREVSTILVIGGSSEYLSYADNVILMDKYISKNITKDISGMLALSSAIEEEIPARWQKSRCLLPRETNKPFLYFRAVEVQNEKKIIMDGYTADITYLTALTSKYQLNTLTCALEQLMNDMESSHEEMIVKAEEIITNMFSGKFKTGSLIPGSEYQFYEHIRPLDVLCCANRMRGLNFINREDRDDE